MTCYFVVHLFDRMHPHMKVQPIQVTQEDSFFLNSDNILKICPLVFLVIPIS